MAHNSSPRAKARAFVIVGALLCALLLVMAPAAFAAPDAATIYVRTDGDDSCDGTVDIAFTSGLTACAVRTIQQGITLADSGGTVNVAPGTYNEQIIIAKPLTVTGADGAVLDGTGLLPEWTTGVKIRSGNVTFNNIDVTNFTQDGITAYDNIDMPNLHITNSKISNIQPGYWGFGIYVGYESEGFGYTPPDLASHLDFSGLLIEGNEITNVHSSALVIQSLTGTPGTLKAKDNYIHDNITNSGIWIDCARNLLIENNTVAANKWGIEFSCYAEADNTQDGPYGPKDITLAGNLVTNSTNEGIVLYEAWPSTIEITGNYIQANGTGIKNPLANTLNASGNSLGSNDPTTVAGAMVGSIDYSPWLDSGMDISTDSGFQGDFSNLWVDDDSPQTGTVGRIQEGIAAVTTGGTVNVAAGTYAESIIINKSATLLGDPGDASPGPGANAPVVDGGPAPGDAFRLANGVSNVAIRGFEIRNFTSNDTGIGNGVSAWVGSTSSITIQDNYFHDLGYNAVLVGNDWNSDPSKWGDHTGWTIEGNIVANVAYIGFELTNTSNSSIEGNTIHLNSPGIGAIFSSARRSETGLTIKDNLIDGTPSTAYPVIYIYAYDLDMANPNLDSVLIEGNTIATTGTPYQIYVRNIGTGTVTGVEVHRNSVSTLKNLTGELVDAEENYWGTVAFSEIVLKISGLVDWSPWCNSDFTTCTYAWPVHNITQGTDYPTIQAAVDAANPGDVIHVDAGTYAEHVAVNKAVSLVGAAGATIDGGGTGTVVAISVSGATVESFTIQHSGATAGDAGVSVTSVSGCTVKSNTVTNNANGIALVMASGNSVTSNAVSANAFYGIALTGASSNTVDLNTVSGNGLDAIALDNASAVGGNVTTGSTGNFIKGNTVSSNRDGIFLGENCDNNQVTDGNTLTNIVSIGVSAWRSDGHTITGNTIQGADSGVRLLGSSNNTITANALTTNDVGIKVDASWQVGVWYQSLNNTISGNDLSGNTTYGVQTGAEQTNVVTAENDWWGSACGPAAGYVSANVDFTPWWADAAGSFSLSGTETTITAGMTAAQQSTIINCAAPGATITYAAGSYPGGVVVTANGVTINLNGATIGAGSSAYTIFGYDVTINGVGTLDGNGTDPAVLVQGGADNFTLQDVEVKNWADGVQVAGAVTSLKVVNNYIHDNVDAGFQVDAAPTSGSVVTIEGNLFKANGGNGIETTVALEAEYNSWGAVGGPTAGDGVSASVDAEPWTFAETYIDVDPLTTGDQVARNVVESVPFDVEVRAGAANVYGVTFKISYDTTRLHYNGLAWDGAFDTKCFALTGLDTGEIGYTCNAMTAWNGGPIATINFTAQTALLTGPGPWTALFDVDHVASTAGTANGAKVYLNNVYGVPSVPARDITDVPSPTTDDGKISITGIAQYTGFIDVQGRSDDSGAVLDVFAANTLAGSVLATATSAKGGAYTTAGAELLTVGTSYYFFVDKPLYLRTRVEAAYVPGKQLTTRPLTTLSQLVLKGGDADNSEDIQVFDATCIGGDYGTDGPWGCGTNGGSSDVNGDGKVDILDLTLMGGNYGLTASDWTP